jgi:hypothetical protein
MKWMSSHDGRIIIVRRFTGTGIVYRIHLDAAVGKSIWAWGMLVVPEKIRQLQKYIMEGIDVLRKKDV